MNDLPQKILVVIVPILILINAYLYTENTQFKARLASTSYAGLQGQYYALGMFLDEDKTLAVHNFSAACKFANTNLSGTHEFNVFTPNIEIRPPFPFVGVCQKNLTTELGFDQIKRYLLQVYKHEKTRY